MNNIYKNVFLITCSVFIIVFSSQCTNNKDVTSKRESGDFQVVDFGAPTKGSNSFLSVSEIIKLESSEDVLIGEINQLEIYEDKIFILDRKTNVFFTFNKSGQLFKKISADAGPHGFNAPRSFWIDSDGYISLLDMNLKQLIKYTSKEVEFVEKVDIGSLNWSSPITFGIIPEKNIFAYYYLNNENNKIKNKQVILSIDNNNIQNSFLEGNATSKILFGSPTNFYTYNNKLLFYPYFSNKVYQVDLESLIPRYELLFHNLKFPEESVFLENPGTKRFMTVLSKNDYIQSVNVLETDKSLVVNYMIKHEKYIGIYDKTTNKVINLKIQDITDDLGLQNYFPIPISIYENKIVGIIDPGNIDKMKLGNMNSNPILKNLKEDDNPILVVYTVEF